jgi:hypothetical protein
VGTTSFSAKYGYDGICKELINKENIDRLTALCLAAGIIEKLSTDLKKKEHDNCSKNNCFFRRRARETKKKKKKNRRDVCEARTENHHSISLLRKIMYANIYQDDLLRDVGHY